MQREDFEHLTRREWRELLRWRAWQAQIVLDQAVEAKRKALANYQTEEGATLENWAGLQRAVGIESEARQKYHDARSDYDGHSSNPGSSLEDIPSLSLG